MTKMTGNSTFITSNSGTIVLGREQSVAIGTYFQDRLALKSTKGREREFSSRLEDGDTEDCRSSKPLNPTPLSKLLSVEII